MFFFSFLKRLFSWNIHKQISRKGIRRKCSHKRRFVFDDFSYSYFVTLLIYGRRNYACFVYFMHRGVRIQYCFTFVFNFLVSWFFLFVKFPRLLRSYNFFTYNLNKYFCKKFFFSFEILFCVSLSIFILFGNRFADQRFLFYKKP